MVPVHPGRVLRREIEARELSANARAPARRVPSGRIVDILNGKRRISRYFGNDALFRINLQAQHDLAAAMRDVGKQVAREVEEAA